MVELLNVLCLPDDPKVFIDIDHVSFSRREWCNDEEYLKI